MTLIRSRARSRAALVVTVAGALVVGAAGTAPAIGAAPDDPRAEILSSFAEQSRSAVSTATPGAAEGDIPAARTKKPSGSRVAESADAAPQALTAAVDCTGVDLLLTQTLDHTHLTWQPVTGATSITVKRQRLGGAVSTLASGLAGTRTSYDDKTHNPLGSVAYRIDVVVGGTTVSCRSPKTAGWWSMSTSDGVGYPDVFFAGDSKIWEQDTYGPASPAWTATARTPAFSANGRLVAAVEQVAGVPSITVRKASDGALQWSVASPAGTMLDEPSFSPDGQRIVAEALDLADTEVSTGLYTFPVNTATHPLTLVPSSAGLATADWMDTPGALTSSTIVAVDIAPGGLLTMVNAATGQRTTVAGTAGALDPMGRADGSIVFTTISDTEATLDVRTPAGALQRVKTWADSVARWPVSDPDSGRTLLYLEEPDPDNAGETVWSVSAVDPVTGDVEVTRIGLSPNDVGVGFHGFDLRTPVSAGTSNFGGSANGDILARSSTGVLYAYPLSAADDRFFDARRQLGTGWGVMKQFIAAGDVNSDRRADIIGIDSSGVLWLWPGKGAFGLGARTKLGAGWSTYAIFSSGDLNGDTRADLAARDGSGNLWLYPGNGRGGFNARFKIGAGWGVYSAMIGPGDWNYDGKADILARDRATGILYFYAGKGTSTATFAARVSLGKGWNAHNGFAAPEFYGGATTLFSRTTDGVLHLHDSYGNGAISGSAAYTVGSGWSGYTITG